MDLEHEIESLVIRSSVSNCGENVNENYRANSDQKISLTDPYEIGPVNNVKKEDYVKEIESEAKNNNHNFTCRKVLDLKNCYEFMGICNSFQESEMDDDEDKDYNDNNQDQETVSCTFDQNQNAFKHLKGGFGKNLNLVEVQDDTFFESIVEVETDSLEKEVKKQKRKRRNSSKERDKASLKYDLKKRMRLERINLSRKRNENEIKKYKEILREMLPSEQSVSKYDTLALLQSTIKYCKSLEDQIERNHMEFMRVERRNFILKERITELEAYCSDQWPYNIQISSDSIRISKPPNKFVF